MGADVTKLYLSQFFTEEDVVFEQTVPSVFNLVSTLVKRLTTNHLPEIEPDPIIDAVLRRERSAPTIIGEGVALPHARIAGIERPYMALGVYPSGVSMVEGEPPVRLVFLLLVPESQPARYLQVLRALASLLQVPNAVKRLAEMTQPGEVMQYMLRSELKLPDYICAGDLMSTRVESMREMEPLSRALDILMEHERAELPIVDEAGHLLGAVGTQALLATFVPKGFRKLIPHLFTAPANPGEKLAELLRTSHRTPVRDAMETKICTCHIDTPAREIAADMAEHNAIKCYVLDDQKMLVGEITLAEFFRRILKD